MECKNCKTVNADDAVFCSNCGTRLDGKKGRILSIISSGIFLATTLIALIATVLAGNKYLPENEYSSVSSISYKMTYAPVIVALVFAVIAFAANVCRVVFGVKSKGNGGYSEEA